MHQDLRTAKNTPKDRIGLIAVIVAVAVSVLAFIVLLMDRAPA